MKRKPRKRKQNTPKSADWKKARHVARTIDILKKVAPDFFRRERLVTRTICLETSSRNLEKENTSGR